VVELGTAKGGRLSDAIRKEVERKEVLGRCKNYGSKSNPFEQLDATRKGDLRPRLGRGEGDRVKNQTAVRRTKSEG